MKLERFNPPANMSGTPYSRVQAADDAVLGEEALANNHFRYDSDTRPVELISGFQDRYPNAKADPVGAVCPMASHIRKVNTRDAGNDTGGTLGTYTRRIMRRGIPFGEPLLEGTIMGDHVPLKSVDPARGNRGLLFLGFLTSIEDQFEFLCNRWMSNRFAPRSPSGDDVLIGLNGNFGQARVRQATLFGSGLQAEDFATDAPWLVPTGGGYFFTPSIDALKHVLAA
jgi:deferrochelatase/peroxidase EfeB